MVENDELMARVARTWDETLERACLKLVAAGHQPERCMRAYTLGTSRVTLMVNLRESGTRGTPVYEQWMETAVPTVREAGAKFQARVEVVGRWLTEMVDGEPVVPRPE